jgi:hypothetical protein
MLKLIGTFTVAAVLIAAGMVIWHGQRQKQLSLTAGGLLLVLLGGIILRAIWAAPPAGPMISSTEADERYRASQMALPTDTPVAIINKMGCAVCHKIPAVANANLAVVGPLLILKTTAPLRLASPAYQARLKAGLAHATTPKEYVIESIVDPAAFIVPGYEVENNPTMPPMYAHYRERFTPETLNFFALFLLQLDDALARQEGLLPLSNMHGDGGAGGRGASPHDSP